MRAEAWSLSQLSGRLRFWEPPKNEAKGTTVSERIRARYADGCKKREPTRKLMRECGVLDDWKDAWDRS